MRAIAVVDGEHYAPVVRDALAELPYEVVGAWLAGGTEKLRGAYDVGVTMGRGGPPEPIVLETPPTLDDLLALSRSGGHAASDYLETAALAGVTTIGCRRCGGGLAGKTFVSNVLEGARLAAERSPDLIVFDGSGAAIPPVETRARLLVAHDVASGLNPYRVLISDLVLTMSDEVAADARALGADVARFDLRLRPAEPLAGRRT